MEEEKVYVYRIRGDTAVYAWTTLKKIAKQFERERDMKLYAKDGYYFDEYEFKAFAYKNQSQKIISDILTDENGEDYELLTTPKEVSMLEESIVQIESFYSWIEEESYFYIQLKKKYRALILDIAQSLVSNESDFIIHSTDNVMVGDTKPTFNCLRINTLTLFYKVNAEAFGLTPLWENEDEV